MQCSIVSVACPFDTRVAEKETENIYHFKDYKVEVQIKIWNCRGCVSVIPIVIGAFGTMSKHLYCKDVDQ